MDPNATLALMSNVNIDLAERRTAAVDMLVWLAHGGHAPDDATRGDTIAAAEIILLDTIDDANY